MRNTAKENAWQYCHKLAAGHPSTPLERVGSCSGWMLQRAPKRLCADGPNLRSCRVSYCDDPIPALKRQIAAELAPLLEGRRAADVAVLIGTEPARISDLRRGDLRRFSLETLIRYLTRMRYRVELRVVRVPIRRLPRPNQGG